MTAQNDKLSAITQSLTRIANDLQAAPPAAPTAAPAAPAAAPAAGSPEEVLELIDNAIEVLEVASETIPAEKPGAVAAPAAAPAPAVAKSKSAKDDDDDDDDDKVKDAADDDDDKDKDEDTKKEMTARIATLEGELLQRQKSAIAEEFVELYPQDVKQAKFDEIMKSKDSLEVLTAQLKVAKEIQEVSTKVAKHVPVTSQGGYLVRQASMNKSVPAWRT